MKPPAPVQGTRENTIFRDVSALNAALASLPPDAFVVAFFLHGVQVSQDEWMDPLARHLREAGFVTVGVTTPQSAALCRLDAPEYRAVLPLEDIPRIAGVQVFIISDVDCILPEFPQMSRVLACCHGLITASEMTAPPHAHHLWLIDGWMCSCPLTPAIRKSATHLWTGLAGERASKRKNAHLHLIPVGYPRLAVLAEELRKHRHEPDAIVYAPTILDYHPELGGERVKTHGERILRTLLRYFPDYQVIFRPYKRDLEHPVVRDILQRFSGEHRFVFDAEPGRLFSFSHGAALVTDFSHIGETFAYATLRAPVYFQPWVRAPAVTREGGVFKAANYSGLVEALRTALRDGPRLAEELRAARERCIMPFDNAFDDIAGLLKDFYADRPRPGWLTVERCNPDIAPDDVELVGKLLEQPPEVASRVAAPAVMYGGNPSPLLAAFALHLAGRHFPGLLYHTGLREALEARGRIRQGEPDMAAARRLYSEALMQMSQEGNQRGKELAERLLASLPPQGRQ